MSTKRTKKVHVVLGLPKSVPLLISLAKAIEAAVAAAAKTFPSPAPPLPQLAADIAAVEAAQTLAHTRARGTASGRDTKVAALKTDLEVLRAYVQQIADGDAATAATVAQAAGMSLRKATSYRKAPLAAKPSPSHSGTIVLSAKLSSAREAHEWQVSKDDGQTWIDLPFTLQSTTTVSGLARGSTVYARHRTVTKSGRDTWSDPVSVLVH